MTNFGYRDPLPPDTPWWGVIIARVLTALASAFVMAVIFGSYHRP
jgi:hypothetical protein